MTREEVTQAVATALGLEVGHPTVNTVVGLSWTFPYRQWSLWAWWLKAAPRVEAEEGGRWGVAWLIASRTVALLVSGAADRADQAAYLAQAEVGREIRRAYRLDVSTADLALLADMGLALPLAPASPIGPPSFEVASLAAKCYEVASPAEREVLDLLAAGISQAQAARNLGVHADTVYARLRRLRRKVRTLK